MWHSDAENSVVWGWMKQIWFVFRTYLALLTYLFVITGLTSVVLWGSLHLLPAEWGIPTYGFLVVWGVLFGVVSLLKTLWYGIRLRAGGMG